MDDWHRTFRNRMSDFEERKRTAQGDLSASIKLRVTGGCYHREHSPRAYEIIDLYLSKIEGSAEFAFEEHESGPELLVFVAAATAGISLAKSIIDLIIAIIKARSEGIKKGDHPQEPLELIVRRTEKKGQLKEEIVLRIGHNDEMKPEIIEKRLKKSLSLLLKKKEEDS